MKKVFYFLAICCFNVVLGLYNRVVYAQEFFSSAQTKYGGQLYSNLGRLSIFTLLSIVSTKLTFSGLKKIYKICFKYTDSYKKFKPDDIIQITFIDGEKEFTQKVRVVSANKKEIVFEYNGKTNKCGASQIKYIQKCNMYRSLARLLFGIVVFLLWVFLIAQLYAYKLNLSDNMSGDWENVVDDYGYGPN